MNVELSNRYEIDRELGRQTGRRTLLARDRATGQPVVIKLLLLGDELDWQNLKLFEREAATLKTLEHPAIPRYLDYLEVETAEGKGFALVQSYVAGRSLEECLKTGRTFSEAEVTQLAIALLDILDYLHSHEPPVIHRDIKPSNIVLGDRSGNSPGQVYLVDFGAVQTLAAHEGGTITVVGTYGYMSPEQFGGRVTPASDLYSLGATLIFLVTGRHPSELPQQNLQLQFRPFASVSEPFARWLESLTQPSLTQRPTSAETALHMLHDPPLPLAPATPARHPPSSDLVVYNTPQVFEVFLPRRKTDFIALGLISLSLPLLLTWINSIWSLLFPEIRAFFNDRFSSAFVLLSLSIAIGLPLSRRVSLRIDAHHITFINRFLGFRWKFPHRSIPAHSISGICLVSKQVPHQNQLESLIIRTGGKEFVLNRWNFTSEELEWLAEELIDRLKVPVVRIDKSSPGLQNLKE